MGLVLQAPTDTLLPLADATAVSAGSTPAQTAAATDGLFASLLASLSASVDQETTDLVMDPNALPGTKGEAGSEGGDNDKETDPLAGLFALSIPLPNLPMAPQADGHAAQGSLAIGDIGLKSPAPMPVPDSAGEGAADAVDAAPVSETATDTSAPAQAPTAGEHDVSTVPTGIDVPTAEVAPPRDAAPKPDASPPTEADASTESTSVVRTVGNAPSKNETEGESQSPEHGRKDGIGQFPRASANGIEHAAPNSAVGELRQTPEAAPAEAVAAPADAAPAPDADVPPQVQHVARTVIERVERGGGEARIHLDPAGLGEVTIHVHAQGDHVRVDVHAERHEAAQLLRDHTQDLSTLLGERGLNLSDVNVGLGRGNSDQNWGREEASRNRPGNGEFAGILGVGEPAPLETHNRLRAAYNPDGALVYRV